MTGSDTCDSMAAMFGALSKADFIKWNPDVWSDCSNIKLSTISIHHEQNLKKFN